MSKTDCSNSVINLLRMSLMEPISVSGLSDILSNSNGPQDSSGPPPPTIPQRPAPQQRSKSALPQVSLRFMYCYCSFQYSLLSILL